MSGLVPFGKNFFDVVPTDLYNMIDDFFNDNWFPSRRAFRNTFKLDVEEKEKEYLIQAELPGFTKDEVNLELKEGRLIISACKDEEKEDNKKNYIHRERVYSRMQRSIYLPEAAAENVKAKLDNGILTIKVPKVITNEQTYKIDIE